MALTTPPPIAEELAHLRAALRHANPLVPSMLLSHVRACLDRIHGLVEPSAEIRQAMEAVIEAVARVAAGLNLPAAVVDHAPIEEAKGLAGLRVYRLEQALRHARPSGVARDTGQDW